MCRPPWIRVVLWLVCVGGTGVLARPFTPLATPIPLPDPLRGKAVWALSRLPDDRLGVGFEGGVAFGVPGGPWEIVGTPDGSPVRAILPAHDRILVLGGGTAGFVEHRTFVPVAALPGRIDEIQAVAEGWVLAGPTGAWLAPVAGPVRQLADAAASPAVLGEWEQATWLVCPDRLPRCWRPDVLAAETPPLPDGLAAVQLLRDGLSFSAAGVFAPRTAAPLLPAEVAQPLVNQWGLLGAARRGPWLLLATYWRGLLAYVPGTSSPAWTWDGPAKLYCFRADGSALLAGTAEGAFAIADPAAVRIARFDTAELLHLQAEAGGARVVTLAGPIECGELVPAAADELWPETAGATLRGGTLTFRGRTLPLQTRHANGLAVVGETAAVAFGNTLAVAGAERTQIHRSADTFSSLGATGTTFYAGTHALGVQLFDPAGHPTGTIGTGRARVRELAPERPLLLFWDGDVRDAQGGLLAHIGHGNPRDAALVSVEATPGAVQTDRIAVLATRPDGPPLVGVLERGHWTPLAIPGLAEVEAEALASSGDRLYVAGRRGVLEVRLPLQPAPGPAVTWRWADGTSTPTIALPRVATDRVRLVPGRWEPSSAPVTRYELQQPGGGWSEIAAGTPADVPADWGRNTFVLRAERNGRWAERTLSVVRPYPIPLRPWALGLEAVALVAAAWGLARWRTRLLLRQKRELEAAVEQRTEQLRKANAAKEEFLASVSHEIRNPLNGVVGVCAILEDSPVGPRERGFVRVLSGCAEQLRSMLDDVLDFSRIERGDVALVAAPLEIRALVEEAVRVMDPALGACTLLLPDTPQWLEGDAGKLRQIVCNLVSNALKYGRPAEAGVELRLEPADERRVRVRLAVRNAGPTIPAEELPRLFESFRRGADTGRTPGFGLGLAVCRRLAEKMGGRMTAASADGQTEFALEVVLPASAAPAPTPAAGATVSRALAVEDEEYNRLALGHALRALGYEIDWAVDGATALQLARRQAYDLVLTDWRLPDIDGDELCRQLLAVLAPPRPPIVAVTAYSSAEKLEAARAAGMAGFVTKPVTREKLAQAIRQLDTGPRPRPALDLAVPAGLPPALALLGDLAPTLEKLSQDLAAGWQQTLAQTRLHDPRAGRAAHALRSLLLLAGEQDLAEQFGLLETAANNHDWETAARLLPFLESEIETARARLTTVR